MLRFIILNLSIVALLTTFHLNAFAAEEKEVKSDTAKSEEKAEKKEGDSLHDLMESIKDDFKLTYKTIKAKDASKKADVLKAIANLKKNAQASKKVLPHKVDEIKDADEKKKQKADYEKQMDAMIASLDKLKTKIDADDWDGAMTIIKEMSAQKKKGHKQFQDEDDDHKH